MYYEFTGRMGPSAKTDPARPSVSQKYKKKYYFACGQSTALFPPRGGQNS